MGGTNQETWKQPPASLNVVWPTDCTKRSGPTLEEQKAHMRETRARVANAIAASGHPVPQWPEVGQSVKWDFPRHSRVGEEPVSLSRQASPPPSWRIPIHYQTFLPVDIPLTPTRRGRGIIAQNTSSLQDSPLSSFSTRPRSKSHQSPAENSGLVKSMMHAALTPQFPNTKPLEPFGTLRAQDGLPVHVDSSIFNPRVFVVELPEPVFQRTPPIAPRAMLEQLSHMNVPRQFNRARMDSAATSSSHRSYETARSRARGCSATTTGSHHSFEPKLTDCSDCTEPGETFKTAPTHIPPLSPPSVAQKQSSTDKDTTATHQGTEPPASEVEFRYKFDPKFDPTLPPPPGFERHLATNPTQYIPPALCFENSSVDFIDTTGTWTYSKIWVSEEERLRINFTRMQEKAHHTNMDKSPFFPRNVSEYAALLAEKKATEAERIRKRIQHNEETVRDEFPSLE